MAANCGQGMMAVRRDNPTFESVVLTQKGTTTATQINHSKSPELADADVKAAISTQIPSHSPTTSESNSTVAIFTDSMNACMQIDGATAAALVGFGYGMALTKIGGGVNLDVAAAGNTKGNLVMTYFKLMEIEKSITV
jgi:L-arabinose isomerase